jgi:hypothetical protein
MSEINPGIRKTVEWLQILGFETTDSGDGSTHDFECDRPHGYVAMMVAPMRLAAEADRLRRALEDRGIEVHACSEDESKTFISASYDPVDGSAILSVQPITDAMFPGGADAPRSDVEKVAEAAEAFCLAHEFSDEPPPSAVHLLETLSKWRGIRLEFGRNGEGGHVAHEKRK